MSHVVNLKYMIFMNNIKYVQETAVSDSNPVQWTAETEIPILQYMFLSL